MVRGASNEDNQQQGDKEEKRDECVPGSADSQKTNVVRAPDFWEAQINVAIPTPWTGTLLGASVHFDIDRNGEFYWGVGPSVGKSATVVSGSATANWMWQATTPTGSQLQNFLTGHSFNASGGFWGGGNATYSPSVDQIAIGVGAVTPQAGAAYQYSWDIGENTHACP